MLALIEETGPMIRSMHACKLGMGSGLLDIEVRRADNVESVATMWPM